MLNLNRRDFMIGCSTAIAAMAGSSIESFAFSEEAKENKDIFVFVFLRGGCDGLNLVAPVSDKNYQDARPAHLKVSDNGSNKGLKLENALNNIDFRLHIKCPQLKELYDSQDLAIIHACGLSHGTRSHFDAMDLIERGISKKQNISEGWMARFLKSIKAEGLLPAVAVEDTLPATFLGSNVASSIREMEEFNLYGDPRIAGLLKDLYQGDSLLHQTGLNTLKSIATLQSKLPKRSNGEVLPYQPSRGAYYPDEEFGESLKTLAQIIKMDVGLQVATVSFGGWDTHENQHYYFTELVEILSKSLGAFYNDLSAYQNRLTILVMSEFGRRLKANKSNGTDHGHGGLAFALGGNVKGGKMYGQWSGLATEQLDNRVDLAVTTDYRTILSEVLSKRMKSQKLDYIFPGFEGEGFLNFL